MTRLLNVLLFLALLPSASFAAELSIVSGVYQREKSKVDGANAGGTSAIEVGGRFADKLTEQQMWYGEGKILLKSYEAGSGASAPDNYTGLTARGGIRYLFTEFSEKIVPYIAGAGGYESDKE